MPGKFEVAVIDLTSHCHPLAEQVEMARRYAAADIRIWLTDQTLNWWPDGLLEDAPIAREWRHAFWDRYVQIGYLAACVPQARWAVALDVVRRRPDIIAQTCLTLQEFTGGRTFVALAAGEAKQLNPYGYEESKPFTRLEETVLALRRLWSGERFDFEGQTLHFRNAQQTLRAADGGTPPISTIGFAPRLRRIAAQHCEYAMVLGTQDEVRAQMATYREEAERAGRDPATLKFWGSATRRPFHIMRWFTYEDEAEIGVLRKSPMCKFPALGGWLPTPNSPFGPDYHYAKDMVSTEWDKRRVMAVLDSVPDDAVPYEFLNEDDMADWIVASVEVGIDMVRFTDRTPEIIPSRRKGHPDFWARIVAKARRRLGAG
ncbi:MAG: LLM class flavin-dependent oxidoreductase [Gammaproteobacteria bacterium]